MRAASMRRGGGWVAGALAMLALAGCAGKAYVREEFRTHPPRRIAVLPFVITYPYDTPGQLPPDEHQLGRDLFRKTFYFALTPYGYEDVKLADVDQRLSDRWGETEAGGWREATPQQLGEALGADALVYGEISRLIHMTTPLYTETSLDATVRIVDARSGETLWKRRVRMAERGGALMQKGQVVDFLQDQARSFNPGVKFLRVSEAAARRLLKDFPNPTPADAGTAPAAAGASGGVRLAVLPFEVRHEKWQQSGEQLRRHLIAHLQDSPFDVIEARRVDDAVSMAGWGSGEPKPDGFSLPDVAKTIDADAVLACTVTDWGRTFAVVQSWVKAEVTAQLLDAHSGEVIWSAKRRNTRQAGILKGPTGFKSIATAPVMGLKTSHLERVAENLMSGVAHELAASPSVQAYASERPE